MTLLQRVVLVSLLIMLSACVGEPAYTPDVTILAAREAAEYERQVSRGNTAWNIGVVVMIVFSGILAILAWQLRGAGYGYQAAKVKSKEAEARRAMLVDLGNGRVLELTPGDGNGVIHGTSYQAAPQVIPAERAPVLEQHGRTPPNSLQTFVIEAAAIVGWNSQVLPRWERWAEKGFDMTAQHWMQATDALADTGAIVKSQGRPTTVADNNDLVWVYRTLERDRPTPQPEQY